MRILATALYTTAFSVMLCSVTSAQQADDVLKLEAAPNTTIQSQPAPTLNESAGDQDSVDEEAEKKKAELEAATKLYQSLIFSVRTKNGFTIYGIPTKPDILPVSMFGAEAKIPWTSIRNLRFAEDGNVTLDLDDGSKLNGFTAVQAITLDKDWGTVTVYRDKLEAISRATQRQSTKQSSFRTPGVPYRVNPQPRAVPFPQTTQGGALNRTQQLRGTVQRGTQPRRP